MSSSNDNYDILSGTGLPTRRLSDEETAVMAMKSRAADSSCKTARETALDVLKTMAEDGVGEAMTEIMAERLKRVWPKADDKVNERLYGSYDDEVEESKDGWTGELTISNPNMSAVVYSDPDVVPTPPHFVGDAETQAVMTPLDKNYRLIHCANGGWIITQELYGPPLGAFTDFEDAVKWMREHIA